MKAVVLILLLALSGCARIADAIDSNEAWQHYAHPERHQERTP